MSPAKAACERDPAGGNPLFVEQLLAMLVEDGSLTRSGEGWLLRADALHLAPAFSDHQQPCSRPDWTGWPGPERAVLDPTAVMGQVFYRQALAELSSEEAVPARLQALVRKGLVRPLPTDIPGQDAFAFTHPLVRESAYAALPKATRADLHERFARWLDKTTAGPGLRGPGRRPPGVGLPGAGRPGAAGRAPPVRWGSRRQSASPLPRSSSWLRTTSSRPSCSSGPTGCVTTTGRPAGSFSWSSPSSTCATASPSPG